MSDWNETAIGNHIDLISGYAFKSGDFLENKVDGALPVIKIKNVANGDVNFNDVVYHKFDSSLEKFVLSKGDVLIAMTGNHPQAQTQVVGDVSRYKLSEKSLLNQRVGKLVVKDGTNLDFIYYLFKNEDVRFHLANQSSGSANQANISKADILGLKLIIPAPNEQTAIAFVLSSLDDKIDLLHRQNTTLEKMAETLFRQWFVEEVKEEWEEGTLDNILTVKGGTTPSTSEPEFWNGSIHWTSPRDITNLNGIYLFDTERKITELGLSKISSGLLPKGTLLMSSRAPVGVLAFCEVPVAINQGYIAILDNKGYSKEFIYLWLKTNIEVVHSFSNGSTFMEISKSAFKTLQLQIPPKYLLDEFQILVKSQFDKIKSNQIQIRTLTALRDTLLPKLMSGEVRVSA
jgi:type I restriction enzyme S subunit